MVNALTRGLEVLQILNRHGASQVRDVHQYCGLPKPTVVRMLTSLCDSGYVRQAADGSYHLTAKTLELSVGYDAADDVLNTARPVMAAARAAHTWPSDLAIFDHDAMVIMDTSKVPRTLSLNRGIGTRLPVTPTALGRAYLAFCPEDERREIISRLAKSKDADEKLARQPKKLARILAHAGRRGYAVSDENFNKTTRIVAVPVIVHSQIVACVNMMAVSAAMTAAQAEASFYPVLRDIAQHLSELLAGRKKTRSAGERGNPMKT
jgi:IclR family mhp operon transcriptional activator